MWIYPNLVNILSLGECGSPRRRKCWKWKFWSKVGVKWKVLEMFHTQLQQDKRNQDLISAILIIQDCFNNISKHQLAFHFPFLETLLQRDNARYIHTIHVLNNQIQLISVQLKRAKKKIVQQKLASTISFRDYTSCVGNW